jgi:hypothetical protein
VDEREGGDVFAVGPAVRKVGRSVEAIVERAGKVKVIGDESVRSLSTYAW